MSISETAMAFFDACETGRGWEVCQQWCAENASFSCQGDALAEVVTLEDYTEWMKGLLTPVPDGHYQLRGFAADAERGTVLAFAEFHGTQTGDGGPVAPTGNSIATDYVYAMNFKDDKIHHMTKIWNDGHSLRQLGWA